MTPEPPVKRKMRRVLAILGVLIGAGLVLLEVRDGIDGGDWFWVVVGGLLLLLGLAELASPRDSAR